MEQKIVDAALDNLMKHSGIQAFYSPKPKKDLDGEIDFKFQTGKELFVVEVKREIRNYQLPMIKEMAKRNKKLLIIAETIFPKIKEEFRKQGIGYLDSAGNIFIQTPKHHLWIEGHKNKNIGTEKSNRSFNAAGLRLIYFLLLDEININLPQRIISERTGVSLGNVNYIIKELKELEFLIVRKRKEFHLLNKNNLIERWIVGFEEKLKPTLHIGNFRFLKDEDEHNWRKLKFKQHKSFWGGEPAGDLLTNYLQPEIFTIYSEETRNEIIKNYKLVPSQEGSIKIYEIFWKDILSENLVHPILVYADLKNSRNSRCIETANLIHEKFIK